MNTFNLSAQIRSGVTEIIKKEYKQGETKYNIYNYNGACKSEDFSTSVYNEETFTDQLHERMNEDERFRRMAEETNY